MVKITLDIDGMACGMCEAHINDAVRQLFPVKKVASSHKTGKTTIVAESEPNLDKLRTAIEATGYRVTNIQTEPYEKKGFSLFRK